MNTAVDRSAPPSQLLLALEVRGIWELQAFFASYPLLRRAPRGDGHPVLVLPGLSASDISTRPLRAYLKAQGYAVHGWKLGPNRGPRPGVEAAMDARLAELAERYQRKVSLIGWSLGGVFAREIARRTPELVRQVIREFPNVSVRPFEGLAVKFVREVGARIMLRGLRTTSDMESEFAMSLMNLTLDPNIETVFLMAKEEYSHLSSSLLRQVGMFGGDLGKFLPPLVREALQNRVSEIRAGRPV